MIDAENFKGLFGVYLRCLTFSDDEFLNYNQIPVAMEKHCLKLNPCCPQKDEACLQ